MPPKKKRSVLSYTHEDLLKALQLMKEGESASSVSRKFDIPRTTLLYKFTGKTPLDRRMGPAPILGIEGEEMLKNWVMGSAVRGFPVTKLDLITSVEQIAKDLDLNLKNAFPNGKPGYKWLSLFLKRHPDVSERTVEKLSKVRATVTERFIRSWFQEVTKYLEDNAMLDVLSNPNRVFNMDETSFFLCPKGEKVLGVRGQRNVYEVNQSNEKENLTVLCNVNASGQVAPTLVVFPGQRLPPAIRLDVPDEWAISKSDSGWINGELFYEYFANDFYRWLLKQGTTFPIVVFLDGHKSHLTFHLSKFCSTHKIVLIALPPNCTHVLQPLDVAVFKPVKSGWAKSVHHWRMTKDGERLTKYNFSSMLKGVFDQTMKKTTIENGFRVCGLCPLNPNKVDYSKVDVLNNTVSIVAPQSRERSSEQEKMHVEGLHCVMFMESFIDSNLLEQFNETYNKLTPIWQGPNSAHDLYVTWKKAKDFTYGISVPRNTTLTSARSAVSIEPTTNDIEEYTAPSHSSTSTASSTSQNAPPPSTSQNAPPPSTSQNAPPPSTSQNAPPPSTSQNASSSSFTPASTRFRENRCNELAKVLSPNTDGSNIPSPFKRHLFWPGTPTKSKRPRKQEKIKLPSVITSKDWQLYEEKKREAKKLEEQKKLERKRAREEKKTENDNKKYKKSKKRIIFDEDEDWVCRVCSRRYSAELITNLRRRWIECDECGHPYHYKCIPKKHLDTYGIDEQDEDDDEVAFICHNCTKENDSDNEPLMLSDLDEEDRPN